MAIRGIRRTNDTPVKLNVDSMLQIARSQNLFNDYSLDIKKLIKSQGLDLKYLDNMSPDVSGALKNVNGVWTIYVNQKHSSNRQRYTIAHELGHYCLHKDFIKEFNDTTFFRKEKDWTSREYEANQFAANLLMPKENVERALDNNIITIKELSDVFGVSMIAMKNRLLNLNYKLVSDE